MKNLLIAILLVFSITALAQNFEGTITWSIKTEITDPKAKAQMEQAQKEMQDPAKMKEMQEQMNNPQFKAMMEQNPQMKAQVEKMLAMMQSGDMTSMIPKGMTIKIKNYNSLMVMDGGMIDSEFLYQKEKDKTFIINRKNKTYSISDHGNSDVDQQDVKVTKTNETQKILNYTCTKYLVETTTNGQKVTNSIWATTEIKDLDISTLNKHRMGNKQALFYRQIEGMPLKMEMKSPEATMTMEVTQIKRGSFSASEFTIPSDYKETPMGIGY